MLDSVSNHLHFSSILSHFGVLYTHIFHLQDALAAGDNDPCSSVGIGNPIFPFCETIKENDLSGFVEQLAAGTAGFNSWAICHSPNEFIDDPTTSDALVFVENIPESISSDPAIQLDLGEVYLGCTSGDCIKDLLPSAKYIKTAPLSHQDAGARCVRAFANYMLTEEFKNFDPTSGSSTCQATRKDEFKDKKEANGIGYGVGKDPKACSSKKNKKWCKKDGCAWDPIKTQDCLF